MQIILKKIVGFFCFMFSVSFLFTEEIPEKYSFFELKTLTQRESETFDKLIQIRGFLYESPEYGLILASEPNLKSCCLGGPLKKEKQLLVEGLEGDSISAIDSSIAVTLKGTLVADLRGSFPFSLKNAEIVNDMGKRDIFWVFFGILVLGVIGFIVAAKNTFSK
jgi:hypothetical protein